MRDPGELAARLQRAAKSVKPDLEVALAEIMERARQIAEETIGNEDKIPDHWPDFAEATVEDPRWMGPLERTGELKHSFHTDLAGLSGYLLSADPKIVFSELGTAHEPPRPILAWAVYRAIREVGQARFRWAIETIFTE